MNTFWAEDVTGRCGSYWRDNIKTDLSEVGMEWILLDQDKFLWRLL